MFFAEKYENKSQPSLKFELRKRFIHFHILCDGWTWNKRQKIHIFLLLTAVFVDKLEIN